MYISMKFGTGVHVFCWEVGVFNRSCFHSVCCKKRVKTYICTSDKSGFFSNEKYDTQKNAGLALRFVKCLLS